MSFNNNIPGTPGMPRLMRPKAVSVSPIHSPIGNVIARPVVTVMSSQGHSQYVMGTGIVPQVYPGARVASAQPTSQPRISAQVMLPQQPRVPVQLGTHVSLAQNRNPNMHGFQNVAFQSHFAYPVQRTMSGQVQATNQLLITGRVDPNSNLPVLKPAVPGMQRPFQSQTQQRYMIPAPVNVGKQFISTQNHGMVSSQVSASVLSGSVVHRHTAQIIPQTVVPMRTNQNIHIMAASASTGPLNPSMSVTNVSQSISQAVPYEASVSTIDSIKDTAMNTPAVVSLDTCEPGSSATVLTTSKSCDLPAVENNSAENSIQTEAVMLVDDNCTTTPSEVTTQNMIASQPVLMVENESTVGTENLDGTFVINTSGSSISDESFSYTVTGDQYEHIVINPLSEESSNTNEINQTIISDENSLSLNEASEENRLINDQGNKVEGKNVDDDVNENTEDNAMEVDNENESLDQIHKAVISQSEMDGSSQDSGPALSGKAPSSCVYCSDEDSQFTGVSSDIFTEDSSNMSWEKFHEKVLNLRVNKDRGKISVSDSDQGKQIDVDDEATSVTVDEVVPDDGGKTHEDDNNDEYNDDETEEPDFVWESYLQQVGATAVPPSAFKHVEYSLQSCVMKGMKLEVQNKSDPCTFWVATVVMTCGPLLRLRYDGYGEDSSNDFWCDFATTEIHHIGWSAQNGKNLQPPDEIKDKVEDWRSFLLESLTGARTAPSNFLEKNAGTTPVDQIRCGMMLELQDALNPLHVWLVQVLENVGGRLYLRLEGTQSSCKHFWMFYLNPRLHHVGWANEQSNIIYRAPEDIYKEETDEKWAEILQTALKQNKDEVVPEDVFKDQPELKVHQFAVGMKLEALNPGMNQIGPATVIKVINDNYFIVEMDDVRPAEKRKSIQICCNSEYLGIFPVSWCQCKGIRMVPPPGWTNPDFVWGEYLSFCNAKAAPEKLFTSGTDDHEFERGMKLEAVNPSNPNQICAATITKIVGPLLWIHLDHMRDIPSHIEDIDSHNIFPVGWCESNNNQLRPPLKTKLKQKPVTECKTEQVYRAITSTQEKGAWCPKIYFNHRCFSGPYLSKGRISDLPKHVGPGPMDLVLKEGWSTISASDISSTIQQVVMSSSSKTATKESERLSLESSSHEKSTQGSLGLSEKLVNVAESSNKHGNVSVKPSVKIVPEPIENSSIIVMENEKSNRVNHKSVTLPKPGASTGDNSEPAAKRRRKEETLDITQTFIASNNAVLEAVNRNTRVLECQSEVLSSVVSELTKIRKILESRSSVSKDRLAVFKNNIPKKT
ncbi:transcription corepressor [Mactra antiquata]